MTIPNPRVEGLFPTPEMLLGMRHAIDPRDRRDAQWYMSEATCDEIIRRWLTSRPASPRPDEPPAYRPAAGRLLFGSPVEFDESMPYGGVRFEAETPHERQLRRLAASGMNVAVYKAEPLDWANVPVPEPTLKALVKKWMRRH